MIVLRLLLGSGSATNQSSRVERSVGFSFRFDMHRERRFNLTGARCPDCFVADASITDLQGARDRLIALNLDLSGTSDLESVILRNGVPIM